MSRPDFGSGLELEIGLVLSEAAREVRLLGLQLIRRGVLAVLGSRRGIRGVLRGRRRGGGCVVRGRRRGI